MRIEYDNTFWDMLVFTAIHQFCSPVMQGFLLLVAAMPFYVPDPGMEAPAWFMAAFYYVLLWTFQIVVFNSLYLVSTKNHAILTRHRVEVGPEALVEETKFNKSFFYWHGVVCAISRPGFVAVYVTQQMAFVIPNRTFASPSERASFLALVKSKIQEATKGKSQ